MIFCYDWGSSHSVGYVDELAIKTGNSDLKKVFDKAKDGAKGFELMNLKKIENFNKLRTSSFFYKRYLA